MLRRNTEQIKDIVPDPLVFPQYVPFENPTWAYGVTTAYRRVPTLSRTLDSLGAAGWLGGFVFAEPNSNQTNYVSKTSYTLRYNDKVLGAWDNWINALIYLSQFNTDLIMLVQDDVEFSKGTRSWITANWPQNNGIVSLYRSARYTTWIENLKDLTGDWYYIPRSMMFIGALAIIIPRYLVQVLLSRLETIGQYNDRHIDIKLGKFSERTGIPIIVPVKSRCQHIGDVSSIYPMAKNTSSRRSDSYV